MSIKGDSAWQQRATKGHAKNSILCMLGAPIGVCKRPYQKLESCMLETPIGANKELCQKRDYLHMGNPHRDKQRAKKKWETYYQRSFAEKMKGYIKNGMLYISETLVRDFEGRAKNGIFCNPHVGDPYRGGSVGVPGHSVSCLCADPSFSGRLRCSYARTKWLIALSASEGKNIVLNPKDNELSFFLKRISAG